MIKSPNIIYDGGTRTGKMKRIRKMAPCIVPATKLCSAMLSKPNGNKKETSDSGWEHYNNGDRRRDEQAQ